MTTGLVSLTINNNQYIEGISGFGSPRERVGKLAEKMVKPTTKLGNEINAANTAKKSE
jgi:hypothetical protein